MTDAAFGCNPGLIPRLLGCAGEGEDCQSGSWGCALLSLLVSVLASVAVVFFIYVIFIFRRKHD